MITHLDAEAVGDAGSGRGVEWFLLIRLEHGWLGVALSPFPVPLDPGRERPAIVVGPAWLLRPSLGLGGRWASSPGFVCCGKLLGARMAEGAEGAEDVLFLDKYVGVARARGGATSVVVLGAEVGVAQLLKSLACGAESGGISAARLVGVVLSGERMESSFDGCSRGSR